jgi:hypothetical protein
MKMTPTETSKCKGDEAHEEVLVQFRRLTGEDGLLVRTVEGVKYSNYLAKRNNLHLRIVSYILAVCVLGLVAVVAMLWVLLNDTKASLAEALDHLNSLSTKVESTSDKVEEVKESTEEIKQTQADQPKLELVPEPDPKKARDTPIKVRITPAKKDGEKPAATVEVPLPVETMAK